MTPARAAQNGVGNGRRGTEEDMGGGGGGGGGSGDCGSEGGGRRGISTDCSSIEPLDFMTAYWRQKENDSSLGF